MRMPVNPAMVGNKPWDDMKSSEESEGSSNAPLGGSVRQEQAEAQTVFEKLKGKGDFKKSNLRINTGVQF